MTQFYSRVDTTLNGDVYSIPFSYIKEEEIQVYIGDELYTDWYFLNDSQIKINNLPSDLPSNTIVSVRRLTDISKKEVEYTNNTLLNKENLNLSQDQLLHAVQEIYDNNIQFEIDTLKVIQENKEEVLDTVQENKEEVLGIQQAFEDEVNHKIQEVSEAASKINALEEAVDTAVTAANTAAEQASIATDTTQEIIAAGEELKDAMDKTVEEINDKITNFDTSLEEKTVELTQEADRQINNIQSTGFYMRDDKLYFINSEGEEEEFKSGGAGAVMFDTKIADHILQGEEALGWALQGTYVSGALYPDFYNKCLEEYKNSSKSWNGSNVSLVGSVVDNQGVLSGFSSTNYAEMTSYYQGAINSLEFVTCVTIGEIGVQQNIFGQTTTNQATFQLQMLTSGKIELLASSVGSFSWDVGLQTLNAVTTGSTYWIKTTFNNATGYEFYLSENGDDDYVLQASNATTTAPKWTEAYQIGNDVAHATNAFKGSIDLKETYINVNGSRYWTGANTIAQNSNGHKFYPITEKSAIDAIYNQYGIADFYGIDEENERVFLPRNIKRYLIESKKATADDLTWYEIYSDGWCRQGGTSTGLTEKDKTITFSKSFKDTTYTITFAAGADSNYQDDYTTQWFNKTVASVVVHGDDHTTKLDWVVEGYVNVASKPIRNIYYCVGNTEVTQAITNVTEVTTSENDTIPLFTGMYFDFKPNNASWLKAGEQQNSAGIYKTCYNTLVEIVNGINNYDLKVINQEDIVSGVVYDEYWILDQDNLTFRTPIRTSERVLIETKVATDDDPTWYNLYSDGWCEQGGIVAPNIGTSGTITLLKEYANTNYTVVSNTGNNAANNFFNLGAVQKTTTSIPWYKSATEIQGDWQANGYVSTTLNVNSNLYFKVANAVQNLELLNAGEVLEGLANVIPDNAELIASYNKPSYKYIDLEFGASGTIYTAPENGFFAFAGRMTATGANIFLQLIDDSENEIFKVGSQWSTSGTPQLTCVLPVSKGQRVKQLGGANVTLSYFRFVYDQSSESEA